ncbi:hypothetical protein ZIOFF_037830 [Zingiber officinale]|uniref:DUF7795 domain-containing protein n=1 Tax=Zingiber officinale TaxID=94328 RepID=A0A8J5GL77_ZINOF|nr:hypothetical protein ZIOFF_037830 [Zingiber officinale]
MFPARARGAVSGFLHRNSLPSTCKKLRAAAIAAAAFPSYPNRDHHRSALPTLPSAMTTTTSLSTLALPLRILVLRQRCSAVLGSPPITAKAAASISPPQTSGRHPLLSSDTKSEVFIKFFLQMELTAEVAVTADTNVQVLNRKLELDRVYSKLGEKITRIFRDYMTKVTEFEELADVGKRFLTGFNRVTAEALLDELDCLKEDAIAVTEAATKSATALDDSFCEEMLKDISFEEEKEPLPKHPQDTSISEVMLMKIISDMLKLDYAMQVDGFIEGHKKRCLGSWGLVFDHLLGDCSRVGTLHLLLLRSA